jgi:AN1-type zinc finger protein 5/6
MATTPQDISNSPFLTHLKSNLTIEIPEFSVSFDEPKQKGNRCGHNGCKKKLSLTDFPCKCGKTHCSMHRPSEVHNCSYDFKADHNRVLMKTMSSAVIANKVDKI